MTVVGRDFDYTFAALRGFWNEHNKNKLSAYKFNNLRLSHHWYIDQDSDGKVTSAIILIPFYINSNIAAHHAHLTSTTRDRRMLKFIAEALASMTANENIGTVIAETQGNNKSADRIARHFGFEEINTGLGWLDYLWDSKQ